MSAELTPLVKVLDIIKPYLPDIVLVGGWVPIVYEQCTSMLPTKMVRTSDVDFACLAPLHIKDDTMDRLLTGAGFRCELYGSEKVPFCRYVKEHQLEIEFLTPLKGDGARSVTELQKDLTAEPLRYLDILLAHNREVVVASHIVRVPWLSAFVYQKGLSFPNRKSDLKRDKDLYYIFKIVQGVGIEPLINELKQILGSHPPKWSRTLMKNLQTAFSDEYSYGVGSVVRQLMRIPGEQDDRDILVMEVFSTMNDFILALRLSI